MDIAKHTPKIPNGPLHVLIIGRVSTAQQAITNIEAGYAYAESILKQLYDGKIVIKRLGEQASGMLVDRQTIVEAIGLIEEGWPDIVLMEDVSKSYRNPRYIFAFVQDCVDVGVRVIAPGDSLDTAQDNWELMLAAAAFRHGMHIPDTRRRVRRTSNDTFRKGGMALRVRFGYRKITKEESESGTLGSKGLRLIKESVWTPVIQQLRQLMVEERKGGTALAEWLNTQEPPVPTGKYALRETWNRQMVLDLLRDPILYGLRQFPKVRHEPRFRDGKHKRTRNPSPASVLWPELAHMSEGEWREMNAVLDEMGGGPAQPGGPEHPRHGVARRKSLCPLQHATCLICGAVTYPAGGNGMIKCSRALTHAPGGCWNHVQVSCEFARAALVDIVLERVGRSPAAQQALVEAAWEQIERSRNRSGRAAEQVEKEIRDLEGQRENLALAIRLGGRLESLLTHLKTVEKALRDARALREKAADAEDKSDFPDTRENFEIQPRTALLELARTSFEFADLMRRIFPEFKIQPVQALDCGLVRPRGILLLDLSALAGGRDKDLPSTAESIVVDLFEPPAHIRHLKAVVALRETKRQRGEKASLKVLARELGIGHMTVKRALGYERRMIAEGAAEPYRVLQQAPQSASRWKPRKKKTALQTSESAAVA
ncbi:MAG: hypothetical protein JWN24_2533 [Phycisphaerales bacterium]|nr:hypothetical protein [Phycisphaerales bacterium]